MDTKEHIKAIRNQILAALSERHDALKDMDARLNDQCLMTLNRAISLLNDALIQADHPDVAPTSIAYFDSSQYSHVQNVPGLMFACGIKSGMNDRITPSNGVPDCPDCLAILEAQAQGRKARRLLRG